MASTDPAIVNTYHFTLTATDTLTGIINNESSFDLLVKVKTLNSINVITKPSN